MRKSTLAEEFEESPKGKRCKIVSQPNVSSTVATFGMVLSSSLPKSLPLMISVFSRYTLGPALPFQFLGEEEKVNKEKRTKIPIYKLVAKLQCKTTWPCPRFFSRQKIILTYTINNYHNKRQSIPQGTLQKTIKSTDASKKLFTHLPMQPTNTANTVIRGIQ